MAGEPKAFLSGATLSTLAAHSPTAFPYGEGGLPQSGKTDEVLGGWNSRLYRHRGAMRSVRGPHPALRATFPRGEGFWMPHHPTNQNLTRRIAYLESKKSARISSTIPHSSFLIPHSLTPVNSSIVSSRSSPRRPTGTTGFLRRCIASSRVMSSRNRQPSRSMTSVITRRRPRRPSARSGPCR